jgi:hypothetical protein
MLVDTKEREHGTRRVRVRKWCCLRRKRSILSREGRGCVPGTVCARTPGAARREARSGEIKPVGIEVVEPMAEDATDYDKVPALPQEEGPESTIDPRLYRELKLRAGHDPFAQRPDVTIPLVKEPLTKAVINRSYAGLDYATSAGSDGVFWPPDTILGKGGSQVIEATNHAIRLMTAAGSVVATKSLNTFFSSDPSVESVLFDPRVVYDRLGPQTRNFVVSLQRNDTTNTASIYLAVSRSSAPADLEPASWCRYKINSVRAATDGDGVTWADYPMVGVGADAFLISNDQFSFRQPSFRYKYAILRVINKTALTNNATACPQYSASIFLVPTVLPGTEDLREANGHVQPAIHFTLPTSFPARTNPLYMVSTVYAPTPFLAADTYRVWRVSNVAGGSPRVDVINLRAGKVYSFPPDAKQPGGGISLNTRDNRIMQVAGMGDTLWAAHATNCRIDVGSNSYYKACIRFLQFFVSDSSGTLNAIFQQDVTFASLDQDTELSYFMPGIAVNSSGHAGISFLASSPSLYLSAAWTTKYAGDALFAPATVFAAGSCTRPGNQVGDYVGAQTNPNDLTSFWFAGESASTAGGSCTWKTQILQVTP